MRWGPSILLIIILLFLFDKVKADAPVIRIGQLYDREKEMVAGVGGINPMHTGGVLTVLSKLQRNYPYVTNSTGDITNLIYLDNSILDTAYVLPESIEAIHLTGGDVVVVAQHKDENSNFYLRISRLNANLELISTSRYDNEVSYRKIQGILPSGDNTFMLMLSRISGVKGFKLIKMDASGSVVWSRNQNLQLSVLAVHRVRLFGLTGDNGKTYHTFIPSYILTRISQQPVYGFSSFVFDNNGMVQENFNTDLTAYPYSTVDFPSMHGCVKDGSDYKYTFAFYDRISPFVKIRNETLRGSGTVVSSNEFELELIYKGGDTKNMVSEHDEALTVGNKHLFVRRINGEQLTEIIPIMSSDISRIYYNTFCRRPEGGWWVTGIVEYVDGTLKDILIGLPELQGDISGKIVKDTDNDCAVSTGEEVFNTPWVAFQSSFRYFAKTNPDGTYSLRLPKGEHQVSIQTRSDLWEMCSARQTIVVDQSAQHDIPVQAKAVCPELMVNVVTPYLVRCRENEYEISYLNTGSDRAQGAYVEVSLDAHLKVTGSSLPYSVLENGRLRFNVPDIAQDSSGKFTFSAFLDCDSTVKGQTHCVEAEIFPNVSCLPAPDCWDGSQIIIEANCNGDSAVFRLKNIGRSFFTPRPMLVLEDDIMRINTIGVTLNEGELKTYTFFANGHTYRVQIPQADCFPYISIPARVLEGCGEIVELGHVTSLPQDDDARFKSIWCVESTDEEPVAFLMADPKGYGTQRFISDSTEIEYIFYFDTQMQGLGKIYLIDTLSQYLDYTTFKESASSQPSSYSLYNNGILKVGFNVDSFPEQTKAFYQFKVKPVKGLPAGTVINNMGTFFRQRPLGYTTNNVFHTIGERFIKIELISSVRDWEGRIRYNVFPNPFGQFFRIEFPEADIRDVYLEITDMAGRVIHLEKVSGNITVDTGHWSTGTYIFLLKKEGTPVSSGRLIKQ